MSYSLWTRRPWSETKVDIAEMFTKWRVLAWSISCPSRRYDSANLAEEDREVTIAYQHPVHGARELSYRAPWATCTLCPDCRRDACEFRPPCRWRPLQPELRASEVPE